MIKGLCKEGLLKEARVLFEQMEENGCLPNHVTYNTIIQGFLQHNEISCVVKYIKMMVDKGFSANATTATILINLLSYKIFFKNLCESFLVLQHAGQNFIFQPLRSQSVRYKNSCCKSLRSYFPSCLLDYCCVLLFLFCYLFLQLSVTLCCN